MSLSASALAVAALAWTGIGLSDAQRTVPTDDALQSFEQRVNGYIALRHRLEQSLPPLEVTPEPARIRQAVEARAAAIRVARRDAEIGELFTHDVGVIFRMQIQQVLREQHVAVNDLLAELEEEEAPPGETVPPIVINGPFPWMFATATLPALLAAFPALPEGLQYRFIRRDLLLVDAGANIIVDVLPDALPPGEVPRCVVGDWDVTEIAWS